MAYGCEDVNLDPTQRIEYEREEVCYFCAGPIEIICRSCNQAKEDKVHAPLIGTLEKEIFVPLCSTL